LFVYLHAAPVPTGVFAAAEDFGLNGLATRVGRAAEEQADATARSPRPARVDPFAQPTSFDDLLAQASGAPADTPASPAMSNQKG
jgi:FMN reductase